MEDIESIYNKKQKISRIDWSIVTISRFLFRISYIGTNYYGMAYQNETIPTIEREFYNACLKLELIRNRENCDLIRCGRTDKGVHSTGNYISINLRTRDTSPYNYQEMINGVLPWDIRILGFCQVNNNFSARFDCDSRVYKYIFPIDQMQNFEHNYFPKLNINHIDQMNKSCRQFIGTHDFRVFCKMDIKNRPNQTYVRTIYDFRVEVFNNNNILSSNFDNSINDTKLGVITIIGSAFLWHQVRLMVGILFEISLGKIRSEYITKLLDNSIDKDEIPFFPMASEIGLILWDCNFKEYKIPAKVNLKIFASLFSEIAKMKFKTSLYNFMINNIE
ncbi:tRNA pseudouridine synthase A family protein [Cryptosporidium andersoni]|uniref:tRNA pseudouridine synthase n=1 Tax=Cryptosporidium andersoni TaxID=117008 RepID=A0A1J4MSY5_9CRYT|nr:tRNA pseudouridine synthase A family protein [Cryptosporidium andersoni]